MNILPVSGFEGYYVDTEGNVYCDLGKGNRDRSKRVPRYLLRPRAMKSGYQRVYMRNTKTGKRQDRYIHRLVAETFISKEEGKNVVNHKDFDRTNNSVENLEWTTSKGNNAYSMESNRLKRDPVTGRFCS